jgi:cell division protein FtsN
MAQYFDEEELEVEEPRRDTEVTLGWGALLGMAIGLLAICGLCFGLGYMVGHRGPANRGSGPAAAIAAQGASDQEPLQGSGSVPKPSASAQAATPPPTQVNDSTPPPAPDGGASPEATVPSVPATAPSGPRSAPAGTPRTPPQVRPALPGNAPVGAQAGAGPNVHLAQPSAMALMVQVAAVGNAEDANVLTYALRRRGYPANEQRGPGDGLIHVRVGPFTSRDEANQWRLKLLNDGYNAIIQP